MARLRGLLERFGRAEGGVAAVEFALILPVMLLVYIGSVEASALISMDRKVQTISGAVGDLVARSDKEITATMLEDYVRVAGGILTPHPTGELQQIVTQVRVLADGTTSIVWSQGFEHQASAPSLAHTPGAPYDLPDEIIDIAADQYVIVAETRYPYKPLFGIVLDQTISLYRENFYLPRFGGSITYTP